MSGKALGVGAGLVLGVATATAATAVTGTATASTLSQAAGPRWSIIKSVKSNGNGDFLAEVATGKTTGWAFDGFSRPTAWERSGSTWTKVAFPGRSNEYVTAAGAASPSDVWAFTDSDSGGSRVLRWNGHTWSVVTTFSGQIGGAAVVAASDVWVFGYGLSGGLGVWHYNGHTWSQVGQNIGGGSALSASDVWGYSGTNVDHWNGHTWASTSVKSLLPPKQELNNPAVTGIIALSASNVYAVGSARTQDAGGPVVVLHYDGRAWAKVAEANIASYGTGQQISTDGSGGLWLPMPGASGASSAMLHYAGGKLTRVRLPVSGQDIDVESVAHIPGTTGELAGGATHAPGNPGSPGAAVILQYR